MKQTRMRDFKKGQRRPRGGKGGEHRADDKREAGARPEQNWRKRQQDLQRSDEPRREHVARPKTRRFTTAGRPQPRDPNGPIMLYGWHTVKAALQNPARKFRRLMLTENARRRLAEDGVVFPIEPETARPEDIAAIVGREAVHQGLYAETDPLPSPDLLDLQRGVMLVLDQITDPHNVGAILRSAAAFGVTAVITTERHSPASTGVLAKAASGALDHVPIVTVPNLARALAALKDNFVQVVGLDSAAEADLATAPLRAPLALVLGAEGRGLRQLTRATCDQLARLDLPGPIASLNVSNAAALALYIAATRVLRPA